MIILMFGLIDEIHESLLKKARTVVILTLTLPSKLVPMNKRITAKDVAKAAGVTSATVSYVLNDNPNQSISEETRKRVMAAVKELRYVPNIAARSLASRRSQCIGVVIKKNLSIPRFNQTLQGIQSTLDEHCYSILLCGADRRNGIYSDYISAYLEQRIDGIIFLGKDNRGPDEESDRMIREDKIPFVAFDCHSEDAGYSAVDFDYEASAAQVTARVLEHTKNKLIYVRPAIDNIQERLREAGVRHAVAKAKGKTLQVLVIPFTQEDLDAVDRTKFTEPTDVARHFSSIIVNTLQNLSDLISDGDAVISSWESWSRMIAQACRPFRITLGELANNGENMVTADFCALLPNYEAGECCAELLLGQLSNGQIGKRILLPLCKTKAESISWLPIKG